MQHWPLLACEGCVEHHCAGFVAVDDRRVPARVEALEHIAGACRDSSLCFEELMMVDPCRLQRLCLSTRWQRRGGRVPELTRRTVAAERLTWCTGCVTAREVLRNPSVAGVARLAGWIAELASAGFGTALGRSSPQHADGCSCGTVDGAQSALRRPDGCWGLLDAATTDPTVAGPRSSLRAL